MLETNIKSDIENKLSCLINLSLSDFGRAGNMLWIGFGDRFVKESSIYKESSRLVSKYSLHVSCAWRLLHSDEIFIANNDFYVIKNDSISWDTIGNNQFDERKGLLLKSIELQKLFVRKIESDIIGGIKIFFNDGFVLEVFPNCSLKDEYWRFFENFPHQLDDNPHFVIY